MKTYEKNGEKHGEMVSAWIDSWSSTVPSQPCDPKVWGTATGLDFMVASQFWGPHSVGNHHHSGGLSKNAWGSSDMNTEPVWIMNNTQMIFGSLFLPKHSEIHARLDVRTMTRGEMAKGNGCWNQQLRMAQIFLDALHMGGQPPVQILAPEPRKMFLDVRAAGGQSNLISLPPPSYVISTPIQYII